MDRKSRSQSAQLRYDYTRDDFRCNDILWMCKWVDELMSIWLDWYEGEKALGNPKH